MTDTCIDCGSQAKPGSAYCQPCDAPIYVSPRKLRELCPECETTTCHRTKRNPYCSATVYKEGNQ